MTIVVTGGAGQLGRAVIASLTERGRRALPASRRTGVDLRTGARLSSVLAEADGVIHCASHPLQARAVDLDGTRRMLEVLRDLDRRPHLVYISIVGVDRVRQYPYYRAKYATEIALERSGFPVTVLRATQFHSLVAALCRTFTLGPVALVPRGLRFQPVDLDLTAERLADLVLGPVPAGFVRARNLAGPEELRLTDAIAQVARREGRPAPRSVTVPAWGAALQDFAAGGNLPGPDAETGGPRFADWLAAQPNTS